MILRVAVALAPVLAFLALLVVFDSFKLVPRLMILRAVVSGALAATIALALHAWLLSVVGLSSVILIHDVAPLTEETLKGLALAYPLKRREVGFLVDAAIVGFAVGAGFAVIENIVYLRNLADLRIWIWIARGFGAALLHAATAAIMAVTARMLLDEHPSRGWLVLVPGWIVAVGVHALYNRALVSPVLAAAILLFVLPLIVIFVFARSERMTREWVSEGLDLDMELLNLVRSGHFGATRLGKYLQELTSRFPGPIVADMFCLLQLDLELSIRVKGMLMAREAGLEAPIDDQVRASLAEREYLQRAIGRTGLLALRPLQVTSDRDRWHQFLLRHAKSS